MENEIAIRVEGLSKRYLIGHETAHQYGTLRETLTRGVSGLLRSGAAMLRGEAIVAGDQFEEFWALRDVDFEIRRGDIVGVIGRNGAGKSTLLKVLSRITDPSDGRVRINGRVASLLEVGTGFHPELSGRENIFLNGAILGMTRAEIRRKFDEIVAFSEVERFIDTPVKRYSSGMYVRLAFAVAAHLEPEILIIDEVLAVGDSEFQKKCLGKMGDIASSGRTILFVSHSMASIVAMCTKAILLDQGKIRMQGDVRQVVEHYRALSISDTTTITWDLTNAPGDSDIKLLAFSASQEGDEASFLTSKPILVSMTICCLSIPVDLNIGFELFAEDGHSLMWSHFTDRERECWPAIVVGTNTLKCEIPAGLLSTGKYLLAPRVNIYRKRLIITMDPPLSVEVHIDHGVSPFWTSQSDGKRPGLIAPILPWTNEATSGDSLSV